MKLKRWSGSVLVLALPALTLLALACGDDDGGVLPSLVLTAEEVGEVFPELAPVVQTRAEPVSNKEAIERATEAFRAALQEHGRVAGYEASYASAEGDNLAIFELHLFESADGAAGTMKDLLDDIEEIAETDAGLELFDADDIGDEAQGILAGLPGQLRTTQIHLRVDRVLAFIVVGPSDEDLREEARQLAKKVAEKIEASVEG